MCLLAMESDVISQVVYFLNMKIFIRDLGFLQTDDRWIVFLDDSLELIKPHADAVHVK